MQDRFPLLNQFIGGFGTVFPGTSTVESDFLILKWSKDDFSTAMMDFSLEGILHTKQFSRLQKCRNANEIKKYIFYQKIVLYDYFECIDCSTVNSQ